MKLAKITLTENDNKYKCSSCTLCIVLFSITFTISFGIGTYFVCSHLYLKKKKLLVLSLVSVLKQRFNKLINGKSQTNRDQKSNLLFVQRHNNLKNFD